MVNLLHRDQMKSPYGKPHKPDWTDIVFIAVILAVAAAFMITVVGCQTLNKKKALQDQYPECWVTDDFEINCPDEKPQTGFHP